MQLFYYFLCPKIKPAKMKKITPFIFFFIIFFNAYSSEVKIKKAETVAKNFLTEQLKTVEKPDLYLVSTEKSKAGNNLFYIFNLNRKPGFIIISGYDNIYPILAYSTESNYKLSDTKPDGSISFCVYFFFLKEKRFPVDIENLF